MFDLSDIRESAYAVYRSFSDEKKSYGQLVGSGSDLFFLSLRGGVVSSVNQSSDMRVRMLSGRFGGGRWRVSRDESGNFSFLHDWADRRRALEASAKPGRDPRPPHTGGALPNKLPAALYHYDPSVGTMRAPLVFHHLFQCLSGVLESGFLVDADISWRQGGFLYSGAPRAFAYIDSRAFYFAPQTQIDMSVCMYHGSKPYIRRFFHHSSWRLNDIYVPSEVVESLKRSRDLLYLAWNGHNVERMVLMPGVVAELMRVLMPDYRSAGRWKSGERGFLSENLIFESDPCFELYSAPGSETSMPMLDARGHRVCHITLMQDGVLKERPFCDMRVRSSGGRDNGHATDVWGGTDVLCPVLRGTDRNFRVDGACVDMKSVLTPEVLSLHERGRILCIEKLHIRHRDGEVVVEAPYGGVLCRDGKCLGHVVAPQCELKVSEILGHGKALGTPVQIGAMAVCAVEVML